ncbi:DUF4288 domain-containing protein [Winogradskyella sp. ECml5-4]|uniref:DUF4288 domain-containing protein n=1 Tax=Flavobacteriaceae TaxID=49546 RepID=UPI002FF0E51B
MKSQEKISNKNGNWFIVEIIEKCEPVERNEKQDLRRVTTWGNHHLIKADSPEKAFDKAVKLGKEKNYKFINSDKLEMESIFVGIGELLPIYEDIEDGAELMWNDYGFISNRRTMRMPYEKKELMKLIKPKQKKE